jgi:hypothetical protein
MIVVLVVVLVFVVVVVVANAVVDVVDTLVLVVVGTHGASSRQTPVAQRAQQSEYPSFVDVHWSCSWLHLALRHAA